MCIKEKKECPSNRFPRFDQIVRIFSRKQREEYDKVQKAKLKEFPRFPDHNIFA